VTNRGNYRRHLFAGSGTADSFESERPILKQRDMVALGTEISDAAEHAADLECLETFSFAIQVEAETAKQARNEALAQLAELGR